MNFLLGNIMRNFVIYRIRIDCVLSKWDIFKVFNC